MTQSSQLYRQHYQQGHTQQCHASMAVMMHLAKYRTYKAHRARLLNILNNLGSQKES